MGFEEASALWGWKSKAGSGWLRDRRREFVPVGGVVQRRQSGQRRSCGRACCVGLLCPPSACSTGKKQGLLNHVEGLLLLDTVKGHEDGLWELVMKGAQKNRMVRWICLMFCFEVLVQKVLEWRDLAQGGSYSSRICRWRLFSRLFAIVFRNIM
ncbi:hypothetical protein L7F22_050636 [Adiantum nelumboides]|nr:hypothetical protein [Adiantum nelumboides]